MNEQKDNKNKTPETANWGYRAGQIIGVTLTACLVAILVAVTAKLIIWII